MSNASAAMDVTDAASASMSAEEWKLRCDLAACYQLTDLYAMSDLAGTHISVRVPGPEHHFLLNPYGMFFDEITASSLIKVDLHGKLVGPGDGSQLNPAGFVIHSAIHMHDHDLACVMHTHTTAITAVGIQERGLLPLSQKALLMLDLVRYHDYEGAALDLDERQRIVRDLGPDGRAMFLRNHGGLTVGRTIAEAFVWMHRMEAACRIQIQALSGNSDLHMLKEETVRHAANQGRKMLGRGGFAEVGKVQWPALLRKLERERGTSYRT